MCWLSVAGFVGGFYGYLKRKEIKDPWVNTFSFNQLTGSVLIVAFLIYWWFKWHSFN
jgi:hypothetical protein